MLKYRLEARGLSRRNLVHCLGAGLPKQMLTELFANFLRSRDLLGNSAVGYHQC